MSAAVRAVYWAFVVSIPIETIIYFKELKDDGRSGVTISRILGIALFGLALADWRSCFQRAPAAFWAVAWYLAAFALSQLWIPEELDARFHAFQLSMLQMGALFLISINVLRDPEFRAKVLRSYSWAVTFVAAAMLLGVFGDQGFGEDRGSIATQDPNLTAALYAVAAVCIAGDPRLLARPNLLPRLALSGAAVGTLTMGILQTGSRGGLLSFLAGVAGLLLCGSGNSRKTRLVVVAGLAAALGAMVVQEFRQGTSVANRLDRALNEGDTSGRTAIYDAAWAMFQERPLMGWGGANNRFILGVQMNYSNRDVHNSYLGFLTEVGLVGSLPLFSALLYAVWAAWRWGRRAGSAVPLAPFLTLLVMNLSVSGAREKIFWVMFAAAVAAGLEAYESSHGRAVSAGAAAHQRRSGRSFRLPGRAAVEPS